MKLFCSLLFLFILKSISLNQNIKAFAKEIVTISPKQVRLITGGSAQIKFNILKPYKICEVTTSKNNNLIQNKNIPNEEIVLNENNTDRISWLKDECGLILSSVSSYSDGNWNFKVTTNDNNVHMDRSIISIIPLPIPKTEISASLGSSAQINCNEASTVKPTYCTIFNNFGRIVSDDCVYNIKTVTSNNFGKWICQMALMGAIKEFNHTVVLNQIFIDVLKPEKKQTDTHLIMSCSLLESRYSVSWCRAVNPNGEKILLTQGLITDRYSTFETNVQQKKCSIKIKLPLLGEEIGRWRLELGRSSNDYTGCFIDTSSVKKRTLQKIVTSNEEEINVFNGNILIIKCSVPWPISYCYAVDPVGNYTYANSYESERLQTVGVCHVSIELTTESTGKWFCGVSSDDGTDDILFTKNVVVMNEKVYAESNNVKVNIGHDVNLLCKSYSEEAIRYCRFTSPSGESFLLQPSTNFNNQRISYWGSGINKGQCGIRLKNIQEKDIGVWHCITSFTAIDKKYSIGIKIESQKTSLAFTLGMSVSGMLLLGLLVIVFIKVYKKYKMAEVRSENRSPSVSSDEPLASNSNINMYTLSSTVNRRHTENDN